ncbi:hypothetical protein, partial [Thomasclavelia cocleata]|uniref:hypothetical protein n=1 Tax=Thomasclavelia cocleata TaxID=69824 RepID=UPI0025A2DB80
LQPTSRSCPMSPFSIGLLPAEASASCRKSVKQGVMFGVPKGENIRGLPLGSFPFGLVHGMKILVNFYDIEAKIELGLK